MATPALLTRAQVAERIQISLVKLDRMRSDGLAPPEILIGRAIRFSEDAFNRWLTQKTSTRAKEKITLERSARTIGPKRSAVVETSKMHRVKKSKSSRGFTVSRLR